MKKYKIFIVFVFSLQSIFSQENLIQNIYLRKGISLNGQWNYIVDMYETGYYDYRRIAYDSYEKPGANAFFLNSKPRDKMDLIEYDFDKSPVIQVPGDWNSQEEKLFFYEGSIWYKKTFNLPEYNHEKRYFLHFGAINYRSDVYLNGKKLGTHIGGFTPFNFEITGQLKASDNFIIIRVDNKRADDEVPTLSTDWWNYGGITRDVSIYEFGTTFIEDYNIQLDKNDDNLIKVTILLNGKENANQEVIFNISELNINKSAVTDNNGFASFEIKNNNIEYWSDLNPKLYNIELQTKNDQIEDKIGFRQIKTNGSSILLNGKKIFLKGISIHEENPMRGGRAYSLEDAKMLLGWAKDLGCNFVRLAHYPHNENMVRLADELGILVWEENPVYWTIQWDNKATYQKANQQLKELINRDKNRASVIIWSMANETPQSENRNSFLEDLISTTRNMDCTRLVSAALEFHEKKGEKNVMILDDKLSEMVDIVSFNEYYGWYGGDIKNIKNLKWEISSEKPVVISEFGAGAQQGFHADSLTRWSEEYQDYLYRETLPALLKIPQLSGISPWILADFRSPRRMLMPIQNGWNRKGLISQNGTKKKAFYTLQEFYRKLKN